MNYLQALKTARDYFGHDAVAIHGSEISPLSELIQEAEAAPSVSSSTNIDIRLQTSGQLATSAGIQIPAWAMFEAGPPGQSNSDDAEGEPLLIVASGKDLPG